MSEEGEERRKRIIQLIREHAKPIINLGLLADAIAAAQKTAAGVAGGLDASEVAQIAVMIYGARDRHS